MAIIIRSTDQTTGDTISNGDDYILREGVLVSDDNNDALEFSTTSGSTAHIAGGLFAGGIAEALQIDSADVTVGIQASGALVAGGEGIQIAGAGATITNAGSVTGSNHAVLLESTAIDAVIVNAGAITGGTYGFGLGATGGTAVSNSGTITAANDAILSTAFFSSSFNSIDNSGTIRAGARVMDFDLANQQIVNTGLMAGGTDGIRIGEGGAGSAGNGIVNSGTIQANDVALLLEGSTGRTAIENSGIIRGGTFAVQAQHRVQFGSSGSLIAATGIELGADADYSSISNSGRIDAADRGIALLAGADNAIIGNDGVISSTSFAILSNAANTVIRNDGTLESSSGGGAVYLFGEGARLFNNGTVTSGNHAVTFFASGKTVNTGMVQGDRSGMLLYSYVDPSSDMVVDNRGVISGNSEAAILSFIDPGNDLVVRNSGTLTSTTSGGVRMLSDTSLILYNDGVITPGNGTAIITGATSADRVTNLGLVDGDVILNGGADILINGGTITGDVDLGGENDFFRATGTGVATGLVSGGAGVDTLIGASGDDNLAGDAGVDLLVGHDGDDTLAGGAGNDTLLGGAGDDSLDGGLDDDVLNGGAGADMMLGGDGNDILVGQDGSDDLDGGDGNDTIDGGAGDDILEGGAGNDILRGRNGEDEMAGGLGRDFLTGGQGADTFVFRAIAETVAGANRDQILDFEQGVDLITVAGLSPGVFEFRGTAAFAPSGNPELRLFETPTGSTIVQMDTNGDGTPDAEIRVANVTGLTAEDFVL